LVIHVQVVTSKTQKFVPAELAREGRGGSDLR
jgi:hypothetical protein